MKIISRKEADNILIESLFKCEGTLSEGKFCTGKYKWTGRISDWYGKEVADCRGVVAVYPKRVQDSEGPYTQLRCIYKA